MEPDKWSELEDLLDEALRLPLHHRGAFLAAITDRCIREEVQSLLEASDAPDLPYGEAIAEAAGSLTRHQHADEPGPSLDFSDRYRVLRPIGEGGMGVVYLAQQYEPVRRLVALKVIKPEMDSGEVARRFAAERQTLAMMDHPHIAKVLDAGATPAGCMYFVMEFVEGVSITQYSDEHDLSTCERLKLFIPVCLAVQHAHQKGIIHRDLKPSNVLVSVCDGVATPKVIDFGLAKAVGPTAIPNDLTMTGAILGTLHYMSPEQARSAGEDLDTRSDIYSLGAILYELLTGTAPLASPGRVAAGYPELYRNLLDREVEPPSVRVRHTGSRGAIPARRGLAVAKASRAIDADLDRIVIKALENDRVHRYASANGLARDIERFLAGEPVEAAVQSTAYRFGKFARKHRSLLLAGACFAVLLVAASIVSASLALNARRERDRALAAIHESTARKLIAYAAESLRTDPELSVVLALHAVDATRRHGEGVTNAAEGMLHNVLQYSRTGLTLQGHNAPVSAVVFSPDGSRVATASEDRTARVWDVKTGREQLVLRRHSDWVWDVVFSPDGNTIATAGPDRTVQLWDARTGEPHAVLQGHQHSVVRVAFNRAGTSLATIGVDRAVMLWDVASGHLLAEAKTVFDPQDIAFDPDDHSIVVAAVDASSRPAIACLVRWSLFARYPVRMERLGQTLSKPLFSADGKSLAIISPESRLRLYSPATGKEVMSAKVAENTRVRAFSPDGNTLTLITPEGVEVWSLTGNELHLATRLSGVTGTFKTFSPDGAKFATTYDDGTVRLWSREPRGAERAVSTASGSVGGTEFSSSQDILATWLRDAATLWSATSGQRLTVLNGHSARITDLRFHPNGQLAITASMDGSARIWDVASGAEQAALRGHEGSVGAVAFGPDGRTVATGGRDGRVILWDWRTGEIRKDVRGHDQLILRLAFSRDGSHLASSSADGTTRIWDGATGRELVLLAGDRNTTSGRRYGIRDVVFSPDGNVVATAAVNGMVRLWNARTGAPIKALLTVPSYCRIAFSPDGQRLAAASLDGSIRFWDARSGRELFAFRGTAPLASLSFDGRSLATVDVKGQIRQYPVALEDLLAAARSRVTRSLTRAECARYFDMDSCPVLP